MVLAVKAVQMEEDVMVVVVTELVTLVEVEKAVENLVVVVRAVLALGLRSARPSRGGAQACAACAALRTEFID